MAKRLVAKMDKVILKPIPKSEQKFGTFIIPDQGQDTPEFGEVISVGPGVMNVFGTFIPNICKIGDIVAIPRIGSFNFSYDGEEYFITREQELLAGLEEDETNTTEQ